MLVVTQFSIKSICIRLFSIIRVVNVFKPIRFSNLATPPFAYSIYFLYAFKKLSRYIITSFLVCHYHLFSAKVLKISDTAKFWIYNFIYYTLFRLINNYIMSGKKESLVLLKERMIVSR